MSSDSGDDAEIKKFLEATDSSLLNNSMFQEKEKAMVENVKFDAGSNGIKGEKNALPPKSQRYIIDDAENTGIDFNLPDSMQKHLAKKFCQILSNHYEFYDAIENDLPKIKTKYKNRVKLLNGDDCFANPYEDIEYDDIKGPTKKPVIKKRIIDETTAQNIDGEDLKAIAIDGNFILSGQEVNTWAKKRERKDKVFHYKMASNGVLHAKEDINEYTKMRHKNKWNESKIKHFRKS